mmetsp:Transcript_33231/g.85182  ORF Transcript_33231/g.85182 Transcript_33231/m.85182 type:complete len:98 (+) Transcript_33231:48-341(+)
MQVLNMGGQLFAIVPGQSALGIQGDASIYNTFSPAYPMRGTPSNPYGHPGYFNGYGGGTPTDTYGAYAPAANGGLRGTPSNPGGHPTYWSTYGTWSP